MAFVFEQCELNSASIAIAILVMYTVVYFPNYFTFNIVRLLFAHTSYHSKYDIIYYASEAKCLR